MEAGIWPFQSGALRQRRETAGGSFLEERAGKGIFAPPPADGNQWPHAFAKAVLLAGVFLFCGFYVCCALTKLVFFPACPEIIGVC